MVSEGVGHSAPRSVQVGPDLRVSQGLPAVEGPLAFLGQPGENSLFLRLECLSEQVPHLQRERDPITFAHRRSASYSGFSRTTFTRAFFAGISITWKRSLTEVMDWNKADSR